ncbi:MAG TPA: response regulator transcription factor [Ilumatobacteraceae bacterium]|nr:response regulator transcription factor [Ilumatobacteraceae bacterium]
MSKPRVLVVDDEENISFLVESALQLDGMDTAKAADGWQALSMVKSFNPQAIVLDVMMPGLDGFEVLRRLRSDGVKVPVLFLTARDTVDDRVRGLTSGGDDYIVKPFAIAELVARVRLALRHAGLGIEDDLLSLADLEMDQKAHRVSRAGQAVTLSPTEYKLLRYLLINSGTVLTRAQILDHVWNYDFGGDASVVETYVSYLRRKIDTAEPKLLHTVRGVGYTLRVEG